MDEVAIGLFLVTTLGLIGSPGPGIAALIAVGRTAGLVGGLRFYAGLQLGLATAFAATGAGILTILQGLPGALPVMSVVAGGYLVHLAWRIATAPVGDTPTETVRSGTSGIAGAVLGVTNPKAYIAFAALMATRSLAPGDPAADLSLKWILCVAIAALVDIVWLAAGAGLNLVALPPRAERTLNLSLGAMIVAATAAAFAV